MPPSERKWSERDILLLSCKHRALVKVQSLKLFVRVVPFEVLSERVFGGRHAVTEGALVLVLVQVQVPRVALRAFTYGLVTWLANVPGLGAQHIGLDEIPDSDI